MTRKRPMLQGHDPSQSIGRFTESGIEFDEGMTPENFRMLAFAIAGPRWKTRLGPIIGKSRWMVRVYATGEWPVPETVGKLMTLLAKPDG